MSILVAAAAGVYAANLRNRLDDVEGRLVDAVMKLQSAVEQLQAADSEVSAINANLGILSMPDAVPFTLAGAAAAPKASGRAFFSRGKGVLIAASGLPVLRDEQAYQVWITGGKQPVNVGVLRSDTQGNATAAFDVPTDAPEVPKGLQLTIEQKAGADAPAGPLVLATR